MLSLRFINPGYRRKLSERNRSELRAQVMDMLTPEQKKKYEEILAESGERRGASARGRVYVLDEKRQPKAIEVRFGLTDGSATEIVSGDVQEGTEVITSTVQSKSAPSPASSPRPQQTGPRMF